MTLDEKTILRAADELTAGATLEQQRRNVIAFNLHVEELYAENAANAAKAAATPTTPEGT